MAYREFLDTDGVLCRAWDTYPTATNQLHVATPLAGGWLSFDSGGARRRLYPVPAGWENASEHQLRHWLSLAEARPRPRRASPPAAPEAEPECAAAAAPTAPAGELVALTRAIVERSRRTLATIQQAVEPG